MIGRLSARLARFPFAKNVLLLASGTVAGQAIMILVLPLLTRLYSPESFGLLGIYISVTLLLSVAACLRLDIAIPLPENDENAVNLLVLAVASATVLCTMIGLAIAFWSEEAVLLLGQPGIRPYLWMFPFGIWLAAIYSAIQLWSIRKARFAPVARTQLVRALGGAGAQAGLGAIGPSPFGLLFGHMLYLGLGSAGLARLFWKHDRHLIGAVRHDRLWNNLREQRKFPLLSVPESLLNASAAYLPLVLVAWISGTAEAGFMLLALRVTGLPIGLLGGNISRVYLAEATARRNAGTLGQFTREVMRNLLLIGFVPFLILAVAAPFLFPWLFGPGWERAGIMVSWLVPFMMLQFLASPVSTFLHATGNQRAALLLQLFGCILILGALLLAARFVPGWGFELYALAAAAFYASYVVVILYLSWREERGQNV